MKGHRPKDVEGDARKSIREGNGGHCRVNVRFEDGSHAKLDLREDESLEDVLVHVKKKREFGDNAVVVFQTARTKDSKGFDIPLHTLVGSLVPDGDRERSVWLLQHKVTTGPVSSSNYCAFCGLEGTKLVEVPGFGSYHARCFKCSRCFKEFKAGDRIFPRPGNPKPASAPVCTTCVYTLRQAKVCRCGESLRGQLTVLVDGVDFHIECFCCNLCGSSLFSSRSYVEKEGEYLCEKHKHLKPTQQKRFVRPKKSGPWGIGDTVIAKDGNVWQIGKIEQVHANAAVVTFSEERKKLIALCDLRLGVVSSEDGDHVVAASNQSLKDSGGNKGLFSRIQHRRSRSRGDFEGSAQNLRVMVQQDSIVNLGRLVPEFSPDAGSSFMDIHASANKKVQDWDRDFNADSMDAPPPPPATTGAQNAAAQEGDDDMRTTGDFSMISSDVFEVEPPPPPPAEGRARSVTLGQVPETVEVDSPFRYRDGEIVLAFVEPLQFGSGEGQWTEGVVLAGDTQDGVFYLIQFEDGTEDVFPEASIRRIISYDVGDEVECRWVEDNTWYPAVVSDVLQEEMYSVTFTGYGNVQQCTTDYLRPVQGSECERCGGPTATKQGQRAKNDCYFCGAPVKRRTAAPAETPAAAAAVVVAAPPPPTPESPPGTDVEVLRQANKRLEDDNKALRAQLKAALEENDALRNDKHLEKEMQELRDRLSVAVEHERHLQEEIASLKSAAACARIRSESRAAQNKSKPLPPRPSGRLRTSSHAVGVGAGRGNAPPAPRTTLPVPPTTGRSRSRSPQARRPDVESANK